MMNAGFQAVLTSNRERKAPPTLPQLIAAEKETEMHLEARRNTVIQCLNCDPSSN